MKKLTAHLLTKESHPALIERMRVIYNSNLSDLATRPLSLLAAPQQQEWWNALDHNNVIIHLYSPSDEPWEIVAFSKVTRHPGGFSKPLCAIDGYWWGKGFGTEIIQHYLDVADGPLYGEQLVSNEAIRHMNARAGWLVIDRRGGTEYLYHPGHHALGPSLDEQQATYDEIIRYHEEGTP